MTEQEIFAKINERATLMLKNPEIMALYQSKPNEEEAKKWMLHQAMITLMYSHEERKEIAAKKAQRQ